MRRRSHLRPLPLERLEETAVTDGWVDPKDEKPPTCEVRWCYWKPWRDKPQHFGLAHWNGKDWYMRGVHVAVPQRWLKGDMPL